MAQFNDTIYKYVGEPDTETEYPFRKLSSNQTNVIKVTFNEEFYTDAKTAYDPSKTSSFKTTYLSDTSSSLVKQADSTGRIAATGELLRFVPGDYKQTAYIKVMTGTFNPQNGVILNNGRGIDGANITGGEMNVFAYGSSIKNVRYLTSVQKITAYYSTEECTHYTVSNCNTGKQNPDKYFYDYGAFIVGNPIRIRNGSLRSVAYNIESLAITNYGKILSVIVGDGMVTVLVEMNAMLAEDSATAAGGLDYGAPQNSFFIEEIQDLPCARYKIDRVESLVSSNIIQEIEFNDTASFTYTPTFPGQSAYKVMQYNHNSSEIKNGQEYLSRIEGNVLGWANRKLYVQCLSGVFDKHNGKVMQLDATGNISPEGLGGGGIDLEFSDFNKKNGFFVNIVDPYSRMDKGDFTEGNKIVQQITASQNWFKQQNYSQNSIVRQYFTDTDYVEGQVLKWFTPKTFAQSLIKPPTLIVRKISQDKKFDFRPGTTQKLLPDYLTYFDSDDWNYTLETALIYAKTESSDYNIEQIVDNKPQFSGLLESVGADTYAVGSRVVDGGAVLGTCIIRAVVNPESGTIFDNNETKKISLTSIVPDSLFTSKEIFEYFGALSTSQKDLFTTDTSSVEYNKIKLVLSGVDEDTQTLELKENDVLLQSGTSVNAATATVISVDNSSSETETIVIVRRNSDNWTFAADQIISKVIRSGIPITLQKSIKVKEIKPYSMIYLQNRSNTGLIYPLQTGNYFESVKSLSVSNNIGVIKSYYGETGGLTTATIPAEEIGKTTFQGGKLIYKTQSGEISTIDITSDKQDTTTLNIIVDVPDINTTQCGFIFTGQFNAILGTNWRRKNLESFTENRTLKYDGVLEEYYAYLTKADIYSLMNIKDNAREFNLFDYFILFNGETDDLYGFGKLLLKKDKIKDLIQLYGAADEDTFRSDILSTVLLNISYEYFIHEKPTQGVLGPIVRESYRYGDKSQMTIDDIGYFTSQDGKIYHKSALIDFRPITILSTSIDANTDPYASSDNYDIEFILTPNGTFSITNSFYLPRVDKLYLNKDGNFIVDQGIPSITPYEPASNSNFGMLLYTLNIPGYTKNLKDIKYTKIENKRYTMRDIGKLEKRINDIEYYTVLSLLEKEATDMIIKDANGLTREKNGIIVDSFVSHAVGDVYNREYNACMNKNEGHFRPPFKTTRLDLKFNSSDHFEETNSSIITTVFSPATPVSTGLFMLTPEKTERFIVQPLATQSILITSLDTAQCEGDIVLKPQIDDWVDTKHKPAVRVDLLSGVNEAIEQMEQALFNNNIAPFGTYYGDWQVTDHTEYHTGVIRDTGRNVYERVDVVENQKRSVTKRELKSTDRHVDLGDRLTDVSISHYIRGQTIQVYGTGLRPNTRFYVFFDDVDVKEYCKYKNYQGNFVKMTDSSFIPKTDSKGNIEIIFKLPAEKFRTGDRAFVVTDSASNNKNDTNTTMFATGVFSASGLTLTKESTKTTVRDYKLVTEKGIDTRTLYSNYWQWLYSKDPLAQTFTINKEQYPNGVYVKHIDLCFATKDPNIPVKVEIRPTVNGYPDSEKIYPNAVAIVPASAVKALNEGAGTNPDIDDPSKYTRFEFDSPVHLPPGDHAFVVRSDSKLYSLFCAQVGKNDISNPDVRVLTNPYTGVLFRSANASTWQADGTTDLMFSMSKLVFDSTASRETPKLKLIEFLAYADKDSGIDFNNTFENSSNFLTFETFNLPIKYVDYDDARIHLQVQYATASLNNIAIDGVPPNTDIVLSNPGKISASTVSGTTKVFKVIATVNLADPHISPVIDLQQSGVIFVRNMVDTTEINNISTILANELLPSARIKDSTKSGSEPSTVRYMTRKVTLTPGFDATNINVLLTAYKPGGTDVAVFVKTEGVTSNGKFAEQPYRQLTLKSPNFYSTQSDDYREMQFMLPEDIEPFDKFSIKICIFTNNSCIMPKIRDMRASAIS